MNQKYIVHRYAHILGITVFFLILSGNKLWALPAAQYSFTALNAPYTSITGSQASIYCDDCAVTSIPLGFTFNFVGTNYTSISLCSNGFAYFSAAYQSTLTNSLSNAQNIGPMLMPLWDDLNGNCGPNYYTTTGVAPNRVFIYEMQNLQWNYYSGCNVMSFEVKLYETSNTIEFCYSQGVNPPANSLGATIGIFGGGTDYQTLPSSAANPVPSTSTFTSSISTRPATGQIYRWAPQSLTTSFAVASFCGGGTLNVDYSSQGIVFNAGNSFNVELSDPLGSFATPTVIGTLASTATSGTIPSTFPVNQAAGTAYRIRVVSTNTAYTGTDNGTDLTINPQVTPDVTITASPDSAICVNTLVTFTATPNGGGPSPSYQWYLNNSPVGTNSPTYSNNTLSDLDAVKVVMTSNAPCATPATATSNIITMSVANPSTPSIFVYADPGDTICPGTAVTFHTLVSNGGNNPIYQWTKNGNPVGTNSPSYMDLVLIDGDIVQCTLTSNQTCVSPVTVTSNQMITKLSNSGFLAGNTSYPTTRQILMAGYKYQVSDAECNLLATIDPVGANPINGVTYATVALTYSVNTYNGQPYVKRHYDIYPDVNEETSTAILTLYAYQSEFSSYNAVAGPWGFPLLPTDSADVAGISNVRITQFHGIGNVPTNYPGPVQIFSPTSVVWDTTYHWWKMTFPVTGFSGFYIHTVNADNPLSVVNTTTNSAALSAYPNPAENAITVTVSGARNGDGYLSLTDVTGKLIQKVKVTDNNTNIDLTALAPGLYIIKYNDDARSETIKVTKQ